MPIHETLSLNATSQGLRNSVRYQAITLHTLNSRRITILVQRRRDVEDVQEGGRVDVEGCEGKVTTRAYPVNRGKYG